MTVTTNLCLVAAMLAGGDHKKDCAKDALARAGNPHTVAPWAIPATGPYFFGYRIGGSVASSRSAAGRPPLPDEGTWGLDFGGRLFTKRVRLRWPTFVREKEPRPGKDPQHYKLDQPETPAPPILKKL